MEKLYLVFKNMMSEKWRIIMNVLAVAIAGSMFYLSFIISTSLTDTYIVINRNTAGNSDLQISSSEGMYLNINDKLDKMGYEYVVGEIFISGAYENDSLVNWYNIHCIEPEDIQKISDVSIEKDIKQFSGNQVIIGKVMAQEFNLEIGDNIELSLDGRKNAFKIYDIAKESGFFSTQTNCQTIILPLKTIRNLFDAENQVTNTYITLDEYEESEENLSKLQKVFPKLDISKTVDENEIKDEYSMYTQIFLVVAIIVLFMSTYIIYANFKTLAYDRIEFLGVIRSIGVSKFKSMMYLVAESLLIGLIGGLLSIGIGILLQYVIQSVLLGIVTELTINGFVLVLVISLTIIISIIGSLFPILKINSINTAEIVKGDWSNRKRRINIPITIIGFVILIIVLVILSYDSMSSSLLVCNILGMIMAICMIINFIIFLLEKIISKFINLILGNRGKKITMLLLGDEEYVGIIRFCSICAAVILMVSSVATGIQNLTRDAYKVYNSDIVMYTEGMDNDFIESLEKISGVDEVYATYELWNLAVEDGAASIQMLDSAGSSLHEEFFDYSGDIPDTQYYNGLAEGKNIFISKSLARKLDKVIGDKIRLDFDKKSVQYLITGIIDFDINRGLYAVISEQNIVEDADCLDYDRVYVKTSTDTKTILRRINNYFKDNNLWIVSTEQRLNDSLSSVSQIFMIIYVFILICCVVGIVGIINSMAISFYKRKKEWGIIMTLGMSRAECQYSLLVEALFISIISGIVGGLLGVLIIQIIPNIFEVVNYPIVRIQIIPLYFLYGIIFMIVVITIPALVNINKLRKLDVVSNLKEK